MSTGFRIKINGQQQAEIACAGLNILSVDVHGDVISEEFSTLLANGGMYGDGTDNTHLTWINSVEISSGDVIEIDFLHHAQTTSPGKTIEQLFPACNRPKEFTPVQATLYDELSSRKKWRDSFELQLTAPNGSKKNIALTDQEFSYSFNIVWLESKPDSARISMMTHEFEHLRNNKTGNHHARFRIYAGQSVSIKVGS